MARRRQIIEIDEEKCTGCGQCILACAEGALALVDGKAKLVGDVFCDGLGACIGECPEGALRIIEREAEDFDPQAVKARKEVGAEIRNEPSDGLSGPVTRQRQQAAACPGAQAMEFAGAGGLGLEDAAGSGKSALTHWPIKLQLLSPQAPYLSGADILLLADCVAVALPDLHSRLLRGRVVAMGCPKLDDLNAHIERLAEILREARPKSLTVAHMEVPCCHGFWFAAERASAKAGLKLELGRVIVRRCGEVEDDYD